jgi:hypothetical protein
MKRVERGVPLEMVDLRTCRMDLDCSAAIRLLSKIDANILGLDARPDS